MKAIWFGIVLCMSAAMPAFGQSTPNLSFGQVPTPGQWNSYFAVKQDVLGYRPLNRAGDTMTGPFYVAPSTVFKAGINIAPGVDVANPQNGDAWISPSGFFIRVNNTTYNLSGGPIACFQLPALVGDITTTAGSCTTALKVVNGSPGTYGASNKTLSAVVDQYGRVTGLSSSIIAITLSQIGDAGTAAAANLGTSGAAIGLLNANKTDSGANADTGSRDMSTASSVKVPTVATSDSSGAAASTQLVTNKIAAIPSGVVIRGAINGLTLVNNGTSSLDTGPGQATSDDFTTYMTLASTMTKTLGAWVAGSGSGGLDTGTAAANTWYHVFVIYNPTSLTTDVILSASSTSPTLPSGYTKKRRVGAIKTTGTATYFTPFTQLGDQFLWTSVTSDISMASGFGTTAALYTLNVPPGVKVNALFAASTATASNNVYIQSPDQSGTQGTSAMPTGSTGTWSNLSIRTNTASQVQAYSQTANASFYVITSGWIDTRGK